MAMTESQAIDRAVQLRKQQEEERADLDPIRLYWTSRQALPGVIPRDAPREVREMARISRVNVIAIVVEAITQGLFVDAVRGPESTVNDTDPNGPIAAAWRAWGLNSMASRQTGLHRAATAYGTAYTIVTPGQPVPVMRCVSPRMLTAAYGDDDLWPVDALESRGAGRYRLYDDTSVYRLVSKGVGEGFDFDGDNEHGAGVCPVIRHRDSIDLDADDDAEPSGLIGGEFGSGASQTRIVIGQVAPLIPLQDQINLTSFSIKVAEWYAAFRQRYLVGWTGTAEQRMAAAASQLWTFDADPESLKVGEFGQTDLTGYLASRADMMRFAATLSQTPVHELTGQLVNLSAEALAAAEIGRDRKVNERETGHGESHLQTLGLVAQYMGMDWPDGSTLSWRDTSARAFAAVVDGLGKLAQMLNVPARELWSMVPGVTKEIVDRWRAAAEEGDMLDRLVGDLDRQARGGDPGGERRSPGGIILPPGVGA
jgi:hypothetical protein